MAAPSPPSPAHFFRCQRPSRHVCVFFEYFATRRRERLNPSDLQTGSRQEAPGNDVRNQGKRKTSNRRASREARQRVESQAALKQWLQRRKYLDKVGQVEEALTEANRMALRAIDLLKAAIPGEFGYLSLPGQVCF
ncbi:hypothetical protein N0V92_003866 [Colletotrichum tropicale]|nr:hypothetical protein N0V92_003866 [Colletotrichum tropicale]